jgi:hypothetical protein
VALFSFARRQKAQLADAVWRPEPGGILCAHGDRMDDDGCIGDQAYGARFCLESAPSARLTIWAYATFAAPDAPADWSFGYRCEYRYDDGSGRDPWTWAQYDSDPDFFDSPVAADVAAREAAEQLASTRRDGPADDDLGFFDWDGVPW